MFTTKQVARDFNVSLKTVQWWCRERSNIKKTGRDYLMSQDDVAEFECRRKKTEGGQDIPTLREKTGRSLPTIYKVAKTLGVLKVDGVYKFSDDEWDVAVAMLRRNNGNG